MGANQLSKEQQEIEQRWLGTRAIKPDPGSTLQQIYGNMENWILQLGDYQLMLYPVNGQWIYYDRIHESWEDSGYKAGEAAFYIKGEDVFIEDLRNAAGGETEKQAPSPSEAAKKTCTSCQHTIPADSKFCTYCGAVVTPDQPRFCSQCGAEVQEAGARFCSQCGAAVV